MTFESYLRRMVNIQITISAVQVAGLIISGGLEVELSVREVSANRKIEEYSIRLLQLSVKGCGSKSSANLPQLPHMMQSVNF